MNPSPPKIPPSPPPINRPQSDETSQAWVIAVGVLCAVAIVASLLFLLLNVRSPDQAADSSTASTNSSTADQVGEPATASTPAASGASEAKQNESTNTDPVAKQATSIHSEAPLKQSEATTATTVVPTTELEDPDLDSNPLGKINNSLDLSSTGRQFYGIATTGDHIGFVIDRSSSMGADNRLKRANTELLRAISNLPITTKVSIVYFSTDAETKEEFTAFEPTQNRMKDLARWSSSIRPSGGTNPIPAIKIVSRYDCDQIFILSDGAFHPQAVQLIAAENHQNVPINTVALSGEPESLKQIAKQSKGTFRSAKHWVPPPVNHP